MPKVIPQRPSVAPEYPAPIPQTTADHLYVSDHRLWPCKLSKRHSSAAASTWNLAPYSFRPVASSWYCSRSQ